MDDAARRFLEQKYALDRAHELDLNRFTHLYEVEQVRVLFLLNGGAFTILVALVELGAAGPVAATLLLAAAVAWLSGLVAAAIAGRRALDIQRQFAKAYHNRRRAVEQRLAPDPTMMSMAEYEQRAERARDTGFALSVALYKPVIASVALFVIGGLSTAGYLVAATDGQAAPPVAVGIKAPPAPPQIAPLPDRAP